MPSAGGTTRQRVSGGNLKRLGLPTPPAALQYQLAAKIDHLISRSKSAQDELNHIPKLVARYKRAVLLAAISGDLTSGQRSGKRYPDWKPVNVGGLFTWASGKSLPKKAQKHGTIPVYGGNGVQGYHDKGLVDSPTLVIGRVGAQCGNVCLTSGSAWITDNAIYAHRISDEILPEFACLIFEGAGLNSLAGGSGQPYVSQTLLNKIAFRMPAVDEQRVICSIWNKCSVRIDDVEAQSARASAMLDRLA
jgi:type I restriction enzyme, S subunit